MTTCCKRSTDNTCCKDLPADIIDKETGKSYCILHAPRHMKEKPNWEKLCSPKDFERIFKQNCKNIKEVIVPVKIKIKISDSITIEECTFMEDLDFTFTENALDIKVTDCIFEKNAFFKGNHNGDHEKYKIKTEINSIDLSRSKIVHYLLVRDFKLKKSSFRSVEVYGRAGIINVDLGNCNIEGMYSDQKRILFRNCNIEKVPMGGVHIEDLLFASCKWNDNNDPRVFDEERDILAEVSTIDSRHRCFFCWSLFFALLFLVKGMLWVAALLFFFTVRSMFIVALIYLQLMNVDNEIGNEITGVKEIYKRLKRNAISNYDQHFASKFHYKENEMARINSIFRVIEDKSFASIIDCVYYNAYRILSGYNEKSHYAVANLFLLLATPYLICRVTIGGTDSYLNYNWWEVASWYLPFGVFEKHLDYNFNWWHYVLKVCYLGLLSFVAGSVVFSLSNKLRR